MPEVPGEPCFFADLAAVPGYAFLSCDSRSGIVVFDLTDPQAPAVASIVETTGAKAIAVREHHLFASIHGSLRVVDWKDPYAPTLLESSTRVSSQGSLIVRGISAYVLRSEENGDSHWDVSSHLDRVDVSNPVAPRVVASLDAQEVPIQDGGPNHFGGMSVVGNLLWVGQDLAGIQIHDASNLRLVTSTNSWISAARGSVGFTFGGGFATSDITDLTAPVPLGRVSMASVGATLVGDHVAVATSSNLWMFPAASPASPQPVGHALTGGRAMAVAAVGNLALVADAAEGLVLVAVGQPDAPVVTTKVATPGQSWELEVVEQFVFVADGTEGLQVIDMAAWPPAIVGSLGGLGDVRSLTAQGDRLYVAGYDQTFSVVDISSPVSPVLRGSVFVNGLLKDVVAVGDHAFVAAGGGGLQVVNVRDAGRPVVVGTTSGSRDFTDICVRGDVA